ncbi:MAG TPA: isocitrate lyase/phosphoenolpyruvate mutase family protein [Silvibacterium sp.]|nr:isocitrate lyase/phosphoenolpyruvate mutase family protein [Silvibacterium sp.]
MHSGNSILLLPNVWDAASARIVEESGFPAIATTSAGIAFSLGYPDGQKIRREEMLAVVAGIVRAVRVPVTADLEAGYGDRPEDAAETARALVAAGAVGMNLEDATGDPKQPLVELPLQLEKIRAVRETAAALNVPLVLNARSDVYLLQVGDPSTRYDAALQRLRAFRQTGADCVFIPGLRDATTIGRLVADLQCPVNVLAVPGTPPVAELAKLRVARVSLGSGPMRATLSLFRRLAEELKTQGTYSALDDAPSYAEMNQLMTPIADPESED